MALEFSDCAFGKTKMCEESACLVPPLETTQHGQDRSRVPSTTPAYTQNGEALVGFHEDALSQAAMGKAQILLALVLGLALASDCSEVTMLNFILPAAELHLCIEEWRKDWLVSITLLSMAIGSIGWGILGDFVGRRRALLTSLILATIFSAVASVMPTYGLFMTARFCSGLGIAGAFPLSFSYMMETCSRARRSKYAGTLHSLWPLGAVYTAIVFHVTMPTLGIDLVSDNREHWSSWHRFLILNTLPTLGGIIGLIWACSESPRYLLEASREVEALAVYQRLHKLNKARTQYGLTELELPGRNAYRDRPSSPTRNLICEGIVTIKDTFLKLFSPVHFRTTVLLATIHLLIGFVYMSISTFSSTLIKELRQSEYLSQKKFVENINFTGTFNETLDNLQYKDCAFQNATFSHINLNHVEFLSCLFDEVEFVNVKSSVSFFQYSIIKNSRFIDTDLTDYNFVSCNLANNTFLSLIPNCIIDFDYNIYLEDLYHETLAWSVFMFPTLLLFGFIVDLATRPRIAFVALILATQAGGGILLFHFLGYSVPVFSGLEVLVKVLLVCGLNVVSLVVVEAYPCHLRCTAHGLMRSIYHLASLCAIPIFGTLARTTLLFSAVIIISCSLGAALLSFKIQDNSKVLL